MGLLLKSEKLESSSGEKTKISKQEKINRKNNDTKVVTVEQPKESNESKSLKTRIRTARRRGLKGDVHDLRFLVEEGPLSFRSFGFVGGFFMILAATLDFIEDQMDDTFTPMAKLITFYLWFCGLLIIQLEGRPFHFQITMLYDVICEFFNALRFVWGRGFFYFFTGCIQFFLFSKYNMVCGGYFMVSSFHGDILLFHFMTQFYNTKLILYQ